MKGLRLALAILASGLLTPSAFGQSSGRLDSAGLPRRPIPYRQLTRSPAPKPTPAKPKPKTARKPTVQAAARPRLGSGTTRASPSAVPAGSGRPALAAPRLDVPSTPASVRPRVAVAAGAARAGPAAAALPLRRPPSRPLPNPSGSAPVSPVPALPLTPPPQQRNGARLAPADPIPPAELEAFVDGVVREGMAADHVAGVAVSVVQNGQIVLAKGYGDASFGARGAPGRPVDPAQTLFRLGTASRLFTALALLKAVEQGRVRLDLPVNVYLPPGLRLTDDDVRRPVLVRHLLSHTGGFEDRALGRLFVSDPAHLSAPGAALSTRRPRRVYRPGELASDSPFGTSLLGGLLANTQRQPFDDLIESELLNPLRMTRTSFREPYPARAGLAAPMAPMLAGALAQGQHWTGRGFIEIPFEYGQSYAPAASASSTAVDMARLMLAVLNGGALEGAQVYGPGVAQLLRTPLQKTPLGVNGWPGGLRAMVLPGGLGGIGDSGHTLAFHSALTLAPSLRLGVFIASNTDTSGRLVEGLAPQIVQRFYASPRPGLRPGDPALAANAGAFNGRYLSTQRARHGLERVVDRLTRAVAIGVNPDGRLAIVADGRTRLWSPEFPGLGGAPSRFRAADGEESLVFTLNRGRAVGFTPAANLASYTRVGWFLHPGLLLVGAIAVAAASLLSLIGLFLRAGRDLRRTDAQAIGGALQAVVGAVWLAAIGAFLASRAVTPDAAALMFRWPAPWLIVASSLALAAFIGSLVSGAQVLEIWRSDRRGGGWSRGRRFRHSLTAAIFVSYGVLLTLWGALTPWSP